MYTKLKNFILFYVFGLGACVISAQTITSQPQNQTAFSGTSVTFSVTATGANSYQWQFNGTAIQGATQSKYTISSVSSSNAGAYSVALFGVGGPIQSNNATLNVTSVVSFPAIPNIAPITGTAGIALASQTWVVSATGVTYAVYGLPAGLSYDSKTGNISGTPVYAGTYTLTYVMSNGSYNKTFTNTLTVSASTNPSVLYPGILTNIYNVSASAVAADKSGNYYFIVGNTIQVLQIGASTATILAGTTTSGGFDGTGASALFNSPTGLCVDASGNVYVADNGNSTIRKITPSGIVTTLAGFAGLTGLVDGYGSAVRFNKPNGIAIDSNGSLYVADTGNNSIRKITSTGAVTTISNASNGLVAPCSVTVDNNGNIYAINCTPLSSLVKVNSNGSIAIIAQNFTKNNANIPYSNSPATVELNGGLTTDMGGNIYVVQGPWIASSYYVAINHYYPIYSAQILKIDINGNETIEYLFSGNSTSALPVFTPTAITTDSNGNLLVAGSSSIVSISNATAAPYISAQPTSASVPQNSSTVLSVAAQNASSYQWQLNGSNIPGATNSTLTLTNIQPSQAGTYTVVIGSLYYSSVTSSKAIVTVTTPLPVFTSSPLAQDVISGQPVTLSSSVTGQILSYQWYFNGNVIAGANSSSYAISSATSANAGLYSITATNVSGSVSTTPVALGVILATGSTAYLNSWYSGTALPSTTLYTSAAYDGSNFLIVGTDGTLFSSANGVSWNSLPSAPGRLNSLVYVNTQLGIMGIGDNGVIVSYSGPSYLGSLQYSGTSNLLTGFAYSPTRMVAVGYSGTVVTSQLQTVQWVPGYSGVAQNINAVAYGNGTFVAVGLAGTILTSSDGLLWTTQTDGSTADLYSIAYGPAGFVAIGGSPTGVIYTSPDGITWTQQVSPVSATLVRVIFANNVFIIVGQSGVILTSVDGGFTWTSSTTGTANTLEGVAFGNNQILAVGDKGTVTLSKPNFNSPPLIATQPQSQLAYVGSTVTFTSTAINASSYQWQFNGVAISGATNPTLTLANLNSSQAGVYSVVAFGSGTPAQSSNATLTVQPALTVPVFYSGLPNLIFIGSNSSTTTYSVTGLPTGLTYDPVSGYISGTLQSSGTYNFTVSVNNGNVTNTLPVSLTVSTPPLAFYSGPSIVANGLAIDSSNNYYFTSGNTIQKLVNGTGAPIIIAGSNTAGGLDGTGTAAMFNSPTGIAVDTSGNLYVSDTGNNTIRKISFSGVVTTFAGFAGIAGSSDGIGIAARFNSPKGIALDKLGNLYVADYGNIAVRKINASGLVSTLATASSGIGAPISLTVNSAGTIYVVAPVNVSNYTLNNIPPTSFNSIFSITTSGFVSVFVSNLYISETYSSLAPPFLSAYAISVPSGGIACDASDNLYVLVGPCYANRITQGFLAKISPNGTSSVIKSWNVYNPNDRFPFSASAVIAIDVGKNILIAGSSSLLIGNYPTTPVIATQPYSIQLATISKSTLTNGYGNLTITATAGLDSLNFQWEFLGTNTAVSTNSVFNLNYNTIGTYVAVVSTAFSAVLSNSATVYATPAITTQPLSQSASAGSTITLSTSATGGGLSYQWYLNAQPITGATSSSYTINSLAPANSGAYYVVATNAAGSVTSSAAIVGLPNPGRIANLSVLSMDGPGSQLLTVGFVTGGAGTSGTQQLLIRGTGPALTAFNVANVLADPTISVYNSSTVVMASNDNWGTPSSNIAIINAADSATGAFALNPTTSNDAALVTNLTTGGYTVQVAGKNSASGNALAEVYDDTPAGTYNVGVPRLINISCLEQFSAGGYLTAGFIIGGTTSETVLIRASGPTIGAAPFNVTGAISDPKLTVYDSNTNVIATNAGWAGNALISAAATKVGAFSFGSSSKDSAVLMTLNPGQYTVQAASASGTAGVTLIEVYEVPAN